MRRGSQTRRSRLDKIVSICVMTNEVLVVFIEFEKVDKISGSYGQSLEIAKND